MRRTLSVAVLALAGCDTPAPPPVSGLILPERNGEAAVTLDGVLLRESGGADRFAVRGLLFESSRPPDVTPLSLGGFSLELDSDLGPAPRVTGRWPLRRLGLVDETGQWRELGPGGGTLTLREVVPVEGGWRVRGDFRAEVCTVAGPGARPSAAPGTCGTASGSFAFTDSDVPASLTGG